MPVVGSTPVTTPRFQEHLGRHQGVQPHNEQGAEPVPGVEGQPVAPDDEQGKQGDDQAGPTSPSSSQTMAKIKSLCSSGKKRYF